MPICPTCGREIDASDAFCRYCGASLTEMRVIPSTPEGAVKALLVQRLDGIKRKNAETIQGLVDKEKYTKFDDWAPFQLQNSQALRREAEAFQVLKEYEYETSDWRIDIFDDAAVASFMIAYRGTIRNSRFNIRSRVSAFLVNKDGKWKLVHEHWSRLPEERRRLFPF